jgi:hypothetical protein
MLPELGGRWQKAIWWSCLAMSQQTTGSCKKQQFPARLSQTFQENWPRDVVGLAVVDN